MKTPPDPALLGQDDCWECQAARLKQLPWPRNLAARMILCPECGNKRCAKAAQHNNPCDADGAA